MKKGCVSALLTWFDDVLPGRIRLYAVGFERLMVENYSYVSELSKKAIVLQGSDGCVLIEGEELSISEMRKGALIVTGKVACVAFRQRRTKA
ncbi:MAG: YabP/YqfC family sporulation protein [Clostridia bacterium]|nr:YabP/YqfC family sporulation protein [Clostridia bacterium]MBQ2434301.1 YabP/YqfC family sporulation protein [Clostridia bacterium]MBQ5771394.1 YabP/YqfC family sporulation protein [Clostridia bacterium]